MTTHDSVFFEGLIITQITDQVLAADKLGLKPL